jgi:thiosulfate/3-mercaptopyruvate sulfurtransferase
VAVGQDGKLRPPDEIRSAIEAASVDPDAPIVLNCITGIASAHSALAYATAGIDTRMFIGSWSPWSLAPSRPVAVGRTPTGVLKGW